MRREVHPPVREQLQPDPGILTRLINLKRQNISRTLHRQFKLGFDELLYVHIFDPLHALAYLLFLYNNKICTKFFYINVQK